MYDDAGSVRWYFTYVPLMCQTVRLIFSWSIRKLLCTGLCAGYVPNHRKLNSELKNYGSGAAAAAAAVQWATVSFWREVGASRSDKIRT